MMYYQFYALSEEKQIFYFFCILGVFVISLIIYFIYEHFKDKDK